MASFAPSAENGSPCIKATNTDGSSIVVYEHGGHLTHWRNASGDELLYLSPKAVFDGRTAIRGGVPLIFPQFGARGSLTPSHGFARLRPWKLEKVENGKVILSFRAGLEELSVKPKDMSNSSNNAVRLEYTICFSNTHLKLTMKITNMSEELPALFHFAFHTYFPVSDIDYALVNGVNRTPYIDNRVSSPTGPIELKKAERTGYIKSEFDRIYPDQACAIILQDATKPFVYHISSSTLNDVCVWNPGAEKTAKTADLPEDAYKHFVCVEHGNIVKQITLQSSSSWMGSQEIQLLYRKRVEDAKLERKFSKC